ncbi:uncharacterized protein LOC9639863 [Selaginella moellendorffii]|uniref:uncharacterized protein LOC9639863 n=1 Tax=Selaginella moellendorffii TaxID=88036 RepID=UPI000D1C2C3A|nr:uncharacterized protein LOC9639863 [Selaginella moellendorffii]|eukprot:XP_024515926.1 uncharacterized protein LOC9639863 [Selaginella moellendorffii]
MALPGAPRDRSSPMPAVQIDVWSDISCPWCYVGKVRLDRAIKNVESAAGGAKIASVKWHPYIIDHSTNPSGEEYLAYNRRRWGSDSWTTSLRRSGAKDGAVFENWKWWPNSLHGHRLVRLADTVGKAAEAEQLLFTLTYEEGQNISDLEVLKSAGEKLGLPNVREYLESGEGKREVLEEDKLAKGKMGLHSVPSFLFNGKFSCSGAMDTKSFEATIMKAMNGTI